MSNTILLLFNYRWKRCCFFCVRSRRWRFLFIIYCSLFYNISQTLWYMVLSCLAKTTQDDGHNCSSHFTHMIYMPVIHSVFHPSHMLAIQPAERLCCSLLTFVLVIGISLTQENLPNTRMHAWWMSSRLTSNNNLENTHTNINRSLKQHHATCCFYATSKKLFAPTPDIPDTV